MFRYFVIHFILGLVSFSALAQTGTEIERVYEFVDEMPDFPGGNQKMFTFLANNINYPIDAVENGIQGTVYVDMIVRDDGSLDSLKINKGIGGGCDEEALRVCKLMPKWKPGKHLGKNVAVKVRVPVKYILTD